MIKDVEYIAQLRADKERIKQIGKCAYEAEIDEKVKQFERNSPMCEFADGVCWLRFGESYARVEAYEKAVLYGTKALEVFARLERSEKVYTQMTRAYTNISGAYHSLQEPQKAWEFSLRCSFLSLERYPQPYAPERESVIEGIANKYEVLQEYAQAISWAYTGLDFEQKVHGGRTHFCIKWHERLARLYGLSGDIEKQTEHLWEVTRLVQKENEQFKDERVFDPALYGAWKQLLEIFKAQGTMEKADCFIEKFLEMSDFAGEDDEW